MKMKLFTKFKTVKSTNDVAIRLIKKENFSINFALIKSNKGRGTMGKNGYLKRKFIYIDFFKIDQKK